MNVPSPDRCEFAASSFSKATASQIEVSSSSQASSLDTTRPWAHHASVDWS